MKQFALSTADAAVVEGDRTATAIEDGVRTVTEFVKKGVRAIDLVMPSWSRQFGNSSTSTTGG
jgi:hypothetical protein